MVTAVHIIKFIVKLLLLIILSPVIILWVFVKFRIYKLVLKRNLIKTGMPKGQAKSLAKSVKIK